MLNHYFGTFVPLRRPVAYAVQQAFGPFGWAGYHQYNKGGNVFEDIGNSVSSFVSDPIGYTGDRLAEIDKTVIQPVYREVIQPVGKALEKVGQQIAEDPITFVAQVAAIATQQYWALPVIAAASTAAKGGNFEQILTATAISAATAYVGANASGWIMSGLSEASNIGPAFAVAGTPISFSTAQTIAQVGTGMAIAATSATGAAIQGRDPLAAAIPALAGTAAGALVSQVSQLPAFQELGASINSLGSSISPVVQKAITGVSSAALTSILSGKDMTAALAGNLAGVAIEGLTSTVDVVGNLFRNDAGKITQFGSAAQGLVANLAATVAANAVSGGKAGAMYMGQLTESLTKTLSTGLTSAYNSLATEVQNLYNSSSSAATAYNTAATAQNNAKTAYGAKVDQFNSTISSLSGLYDRQDALFDQYDAATTQSEVDRIYKEIMDVQRQINSGVATSNALKAELPGLEAQYWASTEATQKAQEQYFNYAKELGTKADQLSTQTNALATQMSKDLVATLDPDFDATAYKAINNLGTGVDPYMHWMSVGKDQGLLTNYNAAQGAIDTEKARLVQEIALAQGYGSVMQMSPEQYKALSAKIDTVYGNNLAQLKDATPTNITSWGSYGIKSLNDALPKYDPTKAAQNTWTDAEIKSGLGTWNAGASGYSVPSGMKLASQNDVVAGNAIVTYDDSGKPVWLTATAEQLGYYWNPISGNVERMQMSWTGDDDVVYIIDEDTGQKIPAPAMEVVVNAPRYTASELQDQDGFTQLYTLAGMDEKALVADFGAQVKDLGIGAAKTIIEQAQSTGNSTLINTAANVVKAGGGFLQSLAGLSVLAGYAPKDTAFGKFAAELVALGQAGNTQEYQSAIANIKKQVGDATGVGGTLSAIYQGFKDAPAEFLAEFVGVEGFQEVAPLLIGGGASTFAKGAALAKGMGEVFANQVARRAGLTGAALSDIAESVGGEADSAFTETYNAAIKRGMSEAQATQVALQVAAQTGLVSGVITAGTMGIGGLALEKALIGSGTASGLMGGAIDKLVDYVKTGSSIAIREGVTEAGEEGLTQAFLESRLYQIDPTRDVAGNITAAAAFGAIAGGPIAGGTYTANEGTNLITNALLANPTIANAISSAPKTAEGAAQVQQLFNNWGLTPAYQADLLNSVYNAGYTSTTEAANVLRQYDNFNPTEADINALAGATPDANFKAAADAYVDPRVFDVDEVKAAAAAEGYTITDDEAKALVGQMNEAQATTAAKLQFDPKAVTKEEATQYFLDLGYDKARAEDIAQFIKSAPETEVKAAVSAWVDPRQVTRNEAINFYAQLGYTPTEAEIAQYITQGPDVAQSEVQKQLGEYVDPRYVTAEEVRQVYRDMGLNAPISASDIARLSGQYAESELAARAKEALPVVSANAVYALMAGEPSIVQTVKDELLAKIEAYKNLGLSESEANKAAIQSVSAQLGTTQANLLNAIGATEQNLLVKISDTEATLAAKIDEYRAQGLTQQAATQKALDEMATSLGTTKEDLLSKIGATEENLYTQISGVRQELLDKINLYQQQGLSQQAATQKALDELSANLGTTKESLLAQIGATETNLMSKLGEYQAQTAERFVGIESNIAATKQSILTQMEAYEKAGMDRDMALDLAISGVSQNLGTTKAELLTQMGTTETALRNELGAATTQLSSEIQQVANTLGKPVQAVTQADIDFVKNYIAQPGTTTDLTYDVNQDGKIDINDQTILERALAQQGTQEIDPETGLPTFLFAPATGSRWAPTGLYAEQLETQKQQAATAKAAAVKAAQTAETAKKQSNFNTLLGMIMQSPDAGGQKVTVQQAPLTEIKNIYDFSSIFATPQQASLFPSPYGQVNVFGQPQQQQGLGAIIPGQQQPFKFAEGGMIGGDIEVGGGGNVDDLLNVLKGNSG